jgi:hypothetical protein
MQSIEENWKTYCQKLQMPEHFALWVEFNDGSESLIPVALDLIGTRPHPYYNFLPTGWPLPARPGSGWVWNAAECPGL